MTTESSEQQRDSRIEGLKAQTRFAAQALEEAYAKLNALESEVSALRAGNKEAWSAAHVAEQYGIGLARENGALRVKAALADKMAKALREVRNYPLASEKVTGLNAALREYDAISQAQEGK